MFKHFINLEWKSFFRSASFQTSLAIKILMGLGALYFISIFAGAGGLLFFGLEKAGLEPLQTVNQYLIYYMVVDLLARYFLQKMPIINIKQLLLLPFEKSKIVKFGFGKTALSFFNLVHPFFFIPFSVVLLAQGYDPLGVICWHLGIMCLIYFNNFLNVILNDVTGLIVAVAAIFGGFAAMQYYEIFDITQYTGAFFQGMYETYWMWLLPLLAAAIIIKIAYDYFIKLLYLDAGLASKAQVASTENLDWLDRFGKLSTFLKNDIKLIKRNKRSKTAVIMSVVFLFYGLLFFTGAVETYDNNFMKIFAGIFVSGGFLFSFGQFVPSWDSSYYSLMMTQNLSYREYLDSKWWLIVIATCVSVILALPYFYFGWQAYAAVLVGGIFNIGVNSHVVLLGGAYIKTPIDLTSNKKAFGDKQAFNMKTMLLSIPKLLLPIIVYAIGHLIVGPWLGYVLVALAGVLGFAFKNAVFKKIEKIYKTEKYSTLQAYKQK